MTKRVWTTIAAAALAAVGAILIAAPALAHRAGDAGGCAMHEATAAAQPGGARSAHRGGPYMMAGMHGMGTTAHGMAIGMHGGGMGMMAPGADRAGAGGGGGHDDHAGGCPMHGDGNGMHGACPAHAAPPSTPPPRR